MTGCLILKRNDKHAQAFIHGTHVQSWVIKPPGTLGELIFLDFSDVQIHQQTNFSGVTSRKQPSLSNSTFLATGVPFQKYKPTGKIAHPVLCCNHPGLEVFEVDA